MPRVHHVKKARKDNPVAKKGESYYWWQFAFSPKTYSKTPPSKSQLTRSEFLGAAYALEERIEALSGNDPDSLRDEVESIIEEIRELGQEQEDKQMNMPDHLQYDSPAGELLGSRAENCEEWASNLENVDLDELEELVNKDDSEWKTEMDAEGGCEIVDEYKEEKIQEKFDELIEELSGYTYEGE